MIEFSPLRPEDRPAIERCTLPSGVRNCDLAFANMYCWQEVYRSAWAEVEGFLVVRFYIDGGPETGYMPPIGPGDPTQIVPLLDADARACGQRLRLVGLTDEGAGRSASAIRAALRSMPIGRSPTTSTTRRPCAPCGAAAIRPSATTSTASRPNIPTTATRS